MCFIHLFVRVFAGFDCYWLLIVAGNVIVLVVYVIL